MKAPSFVFAFAAASVFAIATPAAAMTFDPPAEDSDDDDGDIPELPDIDLDEEGDE